MVAQYSLVVIILGIIGISSSLRESYFNCPKQEDAKLQVMNFQRQVAANNFGFATLDVHVPESGGFLPRPITCIVITDLSDEDGGSVSVTDGGIGNTHAEIRIVSQFLKGLNYRIEVWTSN